MKYTTRDGPKSQEFSAGRQQTTAAQGFAALFQTEPSTTAALPHAAEELFLASLKSRAYSPALQLLVDAIGALREVAAHEDPDIAPVALALVALTVAYERAGHVHNSEVLGINRVISLNTPILDVEVLGVSTPPGPDRPVGSSSKGPNRPFSPHNNGRESASYAGLFTEEDGPSPEFFTPSYSPKTSPGPKFRLTPPPGPTSEGKQVRAVDIGAKVLIPGDVFPKMFALCYGADTVQKQRAISRKQNDRVAGVLRKLLDSGADLGRFDEFVSWFKSWAKYLPSPEQVQSLWWRAMTELEPRTSAGWGLAGAAPPPPLPESEDEYARTVERMQRAAMQELGAEEGSVSWS